MKIVVTGALGHIGSRLIRDLPNAFEDTEESPVIEQPDYPALEENQKRRVAGIRERRDSSRHTASLLAVREAARSGSNLLPAIIEAAKARATLGEISDVLREEWGTYDQG